MIGFYSREEVLEVEPVYKEAWQKTASVPDLKIYMDSVEMVKKEGNTPSQTETQTQQLSSTKRVFCLAET